MKPSRLEIPFLLFYPTLHSSREKAKQGKKEEGSLPRFLRRNLRLREDFPALIQEEEEKEGISRRREIYAAPANINRPRIGYPCRMKWNRI